MPVLALDSDHVTELEFDVFEGLVAQCTATHCSSPLFHKDCSMLNKQAARFISQVMTFVKQKIRALAESGHVSHAAAVFGQGDRTSLATTGKWSEG